MDSLEKLKTILEDIPSDSSINISIDNHIENHIENHVENHVENNNTSIDDKTDLNVKDIFNKSLPYIKVIVILIVNSIISFVINKTNKPIE